MKLQLLRPESQRVAIPGRGAGHPLVPCLNCAAARHATVVNPTGHRAIVHVLSDEPTCAIAHPRNNRGLQHQVKRYTALAHRRHLRFSIPDSCQHQLLGTLGLEDPVKDIDTAEEPGDTELCCWRTSCRLLPGHDRHAPSHWVEPNAWSSYRSCCFRHRARPPNWPPPKGDSDVSFPPHHKRRPTPGGSLPALARRWLDKMMSAVGTLRSSVRFVPTGRTAAVFQNNCFYLLRRQPSFCKVLNFRSYQELKLARTISHRETLIDNFISLPEQH